MAAVLDFKAGTVSGGKLSSQEYEERRQACTGAALARCYRGRRCHCPRVCPAVAALWHAKLACS